MTAPISNGPTTHGYTTMRDTTVVGGVVSGVIGGLVGHYLGEEAGNVANDTIVDPLNES